MKLSNIANIIDTEHDDGRLIEIGLTTVCLDARKILKTYSLPIKVDFPISSKISELTGWTSTKLMKQGITKEEAVRRLAVYGFANRLLVSDTSTEFDFLEKSLMSQISPHRLNVSILFSLVTGQEINLGLEGMLSACGLQFEGTQHRASYDSKNIARLFLMLAPKPISA